MPAQAVTLLGIQQRIAKNVIAEVSFDMTTFPTSRGSGSYRLAASAFERAELPDAQLSFDRSRSTQNAGQARRFG